jgi:hypothetical protein
MSQNNYKTNLMQTLLLLTKLKKRQKDLFANFLTENNKQQLTGLKVHKPLQQQTLKPSSTVTGFKKLMYNFVKLSQNQLQPSYNRRKYNHSHYNQTLKERTRLNRTYAYLPRSTIKNYCAFTVKLTSNINSLQNFMSPIENLFSSKNWVRSSSFKLHPQNLLTLSLEATPESLKNKTTLTPNGGALSANVSGKINVHSSIKDYNKAKSVNPQMTYHRPIPKIVNFLESRLDVILCKNQFASSVKSARQNLRQGMLVNGGLQKKTSFQTLPGDVFAFIK